jgi:UDP-glucose 4-epimerase
LCDALIARGDSVRVLDDLSTGRLANLPSGLEMPGLEIIEGDIAEPATARRASEGVDGCFHLAAIASVERGVKDWLGTHRVNLTGTITIFEAIRQHATKVPVVYASSAAVYGDCETIPIHEAAERHPLSAYGADKYGCELHAITATHVHGIPTVGVRFFNIYGPRQDPKSPYSGVISIFCERILTGAPVNLFGDGAQTRDFVHVSDAVAALVAGMRRAQSGEQAGGQGQERGQGAGAAVFNVCTGQATSVLELAELIGELAGKPPDVRRMPPRSGEIRHSLGDPSNMRRGLGLDRMVTLREGLATVLAHLDARRPDA